MIPEYQWKFNYLYGRQQGRCPIAESKGVCYAVPTSLHHRLHNTKTNRKLYPLFIDSIWNLMAVNHHWHLSYGSYGKIGILEAERRERFLERHPMISDWMNRGTK